MTRAMVLSAGLGTRLRPLTDELPKPLLPFGDDCLLGHAARALVRAGLGPPLVNVHHLYPVFVAELAHLRLDVRVVHELSIRGTAGGIAGVRNELGPAPVVVLNGDAVVDEVPRDFADLATDLHLLVAVTPRPAGQGTVGLGEGGGVVRLRGERFGPELAGGDYVGLCALGARGLAALPGSGCLVADFALPLLRQGERIGSYPFLGEVWLPGDDLTGYLEANLAWLDARAAGASSIGEGASVAPGVELVRSVVGARASIGGRGQLRDCVVCPGARLDAPLERALVTPSGRIVRVPVPDAGRGP